MTVNFNISIYAGGELHQSRSRGSPDVPKGDPPTSALTSALTSEGHRPSQSAAVLRRGSPDSRNRQGFILIQTVLRKSNHYINLSFSLLVIVVLDL